ncbi:DUF3300 domain-containing protein [Psychrobacter okhotskensis]|uniref:hypothetical protein n=1 Tax=Psychrobacter TaxID=497 RepID=UPI000C33A4EE|nr:hypothetical protein [Psychrobacter sp. Sarcosine-3u-12]PKG36053.1 hypothetical protein CXF65_04535 [Psychrobacter sp. Sarcosine-3u-12]
MFKFLSAESDIDSHNDSINQGRLCLRPSSMLLAATMTGLLFLTGCQQKPAEEPVIDYDQTTEKTSVEDSEPMPQSDSAAARIEQFQPLYVAQAQGLQQRLQAEYESLQAADASGGDALLLEGAPDTTANDDGNLGNQVTASNTPDDSGLPATEASDSNVSEQASVPAATEGDVTDADINTSTEVGERDLTVLKRISLEPRKPVMLSEAQIIESYQQAMEALYQPVTTPLSAEDINTLINIATLTPQLFEHAEIAGRVSAKSPALARLIIQHQVWEQIEAQQVLDMQQMKINQQQEFETLMTKFNETIKDYDEQIAKYEQTLKEFQ